MPESEPPSPGLRFSRRIPPPPIPRPPPPIDVDTGRPIPGDGRPRSAYANRAPRWAVYSARAILIAPLYGFFVFLGHGAFQTSWFFSAISPALACVAGYVIEQIVRIASSQPE